MGVISSTKRVVGIAVLGAILCGAAYLGRDRFAPKAADEPKLQMGGTSAAASIIENSWRRGYRVATGVNLEYDSAGSTEGINRLIDGDCAIAFSHTPMSDAQRKKAEAKGGEVLQIPATLCAVVPVYNVKELHGKPPLYFTGELLADIFLGKIDRWNHPAFKAINPDAPLPDTKIAVVTRADSSGTTLIVTEYLHGISPAWQKTVGPPKGKVDWPVGEPKVRSKGVAEHIVETDGSIGFLDLVIVDPLADQNISYGAVQNRDRTAFIHAESPNITAALASIAAEIPDDLTFSLTNRPGPESYPICGGIWAILFKQQPGTTRKQVSDFLQWMLDKGQASAPDLSYAPLPPALIERAKERVKTIGTRS